MSTNNPLDPHQRRMYRSLRRRAAREQRRRQEQISRLVEQHRGHATRPRRRRAG